MRPTPARAGERETETRAFWVWNRDTPLTRTEADRLRAGGVTRLYWHVGELVARPGGALAWLSRHPAPTISSPALDGLELISTVRLATELRSPELFTADALAEKLAEVAAVAHGHVQVDYDCPDRLISGRELRTQRISPYFRSGMTDQLIGPIRAHRGYLTVCLLFT